MRTIHSIPITHPYTVAIWLIDDAASHPIWNQYYVHLVHLRGVGPEGNPPKKGIPDATHEWLCFALNPDHRVEPVEQWSEDWQVAVLMPPNMGYHIVAENDAEAMQRVDAALRLAPSLDTDFRSWWRARFGEPVGGFSLVRNALTGC